MSHFKSLTANQIVTQQQNDSDAPPQGGIQQRNRFRPFSGMTFRYGILEASAEEILAQLCDSANDAEKASQVKSSASAKKYVYRAGLNNRKIANSNRLLEAIYIM
jgi:hypothetical protein